MHCVDLDESFQNLMHIFLQNLASIQPRTSRVKFARPTLGGGESADVHVAHEEVAARNADVGDPHGAVVHSVVPDLLADVAQLDARQRFVRLPISDREEEPSVHKH